MKTLLASLALLSSLLYNSFTRSNFRTSKAVSFTITDTIKKNKKSTAALDPESKDTVWAEDYFEEKKTKPAVITKEGDASNYKWKPFKTNAKASYYHKMFNGRMTANGEIFQNSEISAAHKTLPFGTMLKVTNRRNGNSIVVRINDRGPYIKGREIDLSKSAFDSIGKISRGILDVDIEIAK